MAVASNTSHEIASESFLAYAQVYLKAAEDLFGVQGIDFVVTQEPLYFLYAHSIELALKTHLRVLGVPTAVLITKKFGHNLESLLRGHKDLTDGLDRKTELSILNVTSLLQRGNVDQGLRYYTKKSQYLPSLVWTQDVARKAVARAETAVRENPTKGFNPDAADKVVIIWGKPGSPNHVRFVV